MRENCRSGLKDHTTDSALHSFNIVITGDGRRNRLNAEAEIFFFSILLPCQSWQLAAYVAFSRKPQARIIPPVFFVLFLFSNKMSSALTDAASFGTTVLYNFLHTWSFNQSVIPFPFCLICLHC